MVNNEMRRMENSPLCRFRKIRHADYYLVGTAVKTKRYLKRCSPSSAVHDRMPVILDPSGYDIWLDPGMRNVDAVCELLKPYDARKMRSYPVSSRINHVANDDEECSRTVEIVEEQPGLFADQ